MEYAHHAWLDAVAKDAAREYQMVRDRFKSPDTIQERGHNYEAIFRRMLLGWLPPQYEIGTRKYLVLERSVGGAIHSAETDLVIFHPSYPRDLRERSEVLLSGVVAAFSVKSELSTTLLGDAITNARLVRAGFAERRGSEVGELLSPLIYGVLAHSYSKRTRDPRASVTKKLRAEAKKQADPRRQLDIVCVADLDCWYRTIEVWADEVETREPSPHDKYIDFWRSAYQPPEIDEIPVVNPNAVATLISQLWAKLATRDPQLAYLARGFEVTNTGMHPGTGATRPLDVLDVSGPLRARLFEQETIRRFD
ncbi:DUF6602 domain-containing protein [Mycobacterium sp. 29Ha]|uniref:DUF6602 domain-containing protein n=1 Tax=Mycobacterium sp. 29Ha TaxID=2939268 RepID=UPI0029392329|nr:DUF6602 domain-containing protein [Mycobacterium sp. 29Ha]MDV3135820.1 hypothetical protein [Mycobacterium sp. 29Ha]